MIAESRIKKYDGEKVTFCYERHEDGEKVEEEIDEFKRKMNNWQTRILLTFAINPLRCEKCGAIMRP